MSKESESVPVEVFPAEVEPVEVVPPAHVAETPKAIPVARETLSDVDGAKGYVRPLRNAIQHVRQDGTRCAITILRSDVSDFHARMPGVLDRHVCTGCKQEVLAKDFVWNGTDERVTK